MTTNRTKNSDIRFAFFGTSHIAVYVLDALRSADLVPKRIITQTPKPQGRGLASRATEVEHWAREHDIPVAYDTKEFEEAAWEVAVVVDYGNFLPERLLDIPRRGFLNVHPSLLPRLRGASPMRSALLKDEKKTGVTIMLVNERMDEGPVVAQKKVDIQNWPVRNAELEEILLREGGALLAEILPQWVAGDIDAHEQNHDVATYAEKIKKEDGLLDLKADAYHNLLKIRAYEGWPGTYTFFERGGKNIRVGILEAHLEGAKLVLDSVKPEGKREMPYAEFLRSGAKPL